MTVVHDKKPVNWRKKISAVILVAVLAYAYGAPYVAEWTGWDLPSIRNDNSSTATIDPESDSHNHRPDLGAPLDAKLGNRSSNNSSSHSNSPSSYLTPTGKKNRLQSPAGLVYGESRGEHRVDHVMRHAVDDKNRPVHSVFDGTQDEILKVIDEAYEQIKSKSNRVKSKPDKRLDFRTAYTVDMKRKIGYLGGKRGQRENYPSRSKLTLVLDNEKFVITAYSDR